MATSGLLWMLCCEHHDEHGCANMFLNPHIEFYWIYPDVELCDPVLLLVFQGTSMLLSVMAAPPYISTNTAQGLQFLLVLTNTRLCSVTAVQMRVKWDHIVVLACISLTISDVEWLFRYLLAICVSSLDKRLFKPIALTQLSYWHCWAVGVVRISWILSPY